MMYNWNKIINKPYNSKKYSPNHHYIYWGGGTVILVILKMMSNSYLVFNKASAQNGLRK